MITQRSGLWQANSKDKIKRIKAQFTKIGAGLMETNSGW